MTRAAVTRERSALDGEERLTDPRGYVRPGRDAVAVEVGRILGLLAHA